MQVSKASFCEQCGEDLREAPCQGHERRTQIDLVFEKVVTHVDAQIKACPNCEAQARGPFPQGFCGPLRYGVGIKAYVLNLLLAQMVALKRVQHSIQTLIGQVISEATILKYVLVLHQALEQWERLKEHECAVLLFARDPHVAFTNNRAERDLPMSKVKQKVSGCFRKAQCAQAYCRISSYLQTMANRGHNPLVAIQLALSGQLYAQAGE